MKSNIYETSWHGYPKVWALGHPNLKDEIMPKLWKIFFKKYGGNVVKGFPDWYKKQLMEKQFEEKHESKIN